MVDCAHNIELNLSDDFFCIECKYIFTKDEIVHYIKKAHKYDLLMKANSEIVQGNISHTEIYQENKKLKEIIENVKGLVLNECGIPHLHHPNCGKCYSCRLEIKLKELLEEEK